MVPSSSGDEKKRKSSPAKRKTAAKKKAAKKPVTRKKAAKKRVAAKTAATAGAKGRKAMAPPQVSPKERYEMIARMAYFRAEKRGFEPGWEQEDWLESERLIDAMLKNMN